MKNRHLVPGNDGQCFCEILFVCTFCFGRAVVSFDANSTVSTVSSCMLEKKLLSVDHLTAVKFVKCVLALIFMPREDDSGSVTVRTSQTGVQLG